MFLKYWLIGHRLIWNGGSDKKEGIKIWRERKKALTLHRFWETTRGENEDIERITIDKK